MPVIHGGDDDDAAAAEWWLCRIIPVIFPRCVVDVS